MTGGLKEAGLQESVRTNRNCIRGTIMWVSKHIFAKRVANKHYCVDAAVIDFRDKCLTRGDLDEICREVSRSHSIPIYREKGLTLTRSKLSWDEKGYIVVGLVPFKPIIKRNIVTERYCGRFSTL